MNNLRLKFLGHHVAPSVYDSVFMTVKGRKIDGALFHNSSGIGDN